MDLKMTTNISSHEEQLGGPPTNDIAEGDGNTPLKDANFKHGREEYEVQETKPGMEHVTANIDTLLTELVFRIFRFLGKESAACLGLTCPRLYAFLKHQYPHPICLRCHEGCGLSFDGSDFSHYCVTWDFNHGLTEAPPWERDKRDLGNRIREWMGPQYVLVTMEAGLLERYSVFIHPNLYDLVMDAVTTGKTVDENGSTLWAQCMEWAFAAVDDKTSIHNPCFKSRLPKPYSKGSDWAAEAMAAIKGDIFRFDNVDDWRTSRRT